jgi:hypothetical protein
VDPDVPKVISMLAMFYESKFPAPQLMLPKMVSVLEHCHASGQTLTRWYVYLQELIQKHYLAHGNCFFYGNSESFMLGDEEYFSEQQLANDFARSTAL